MFHPRFKAPLYLLISLGATAPVYSQSPPPDSATSVENPEAAEGPEEDVPGNMRQFIQINRDVFKSATPPGKPQR